MKLKKNVRAFITINKKVVTKYFYTKEESEIWKQKIKNELSDVFIQDGEIWEKIIGFSRYLASNHGRILSLNYKNSGVNKLIHPQVSKNGYLQSIFLADDGKYYTRKVHFLVSLAFFGEREQNYEVNHKDGIKTHNSIDNLEYVTRSQNVQHAFDNELATGKIGSTNGNSKLTDEKVRYIRERKRDGGKRWGRTKIAKELGISSAHVKAIANSKTLWKHILV